MFIGGTIVKVKITLHIVVSLDIKHKKPGFNDVLRGKRTFFKVGFGTFA